MLLLLVPIIKCDMKHPAKLSVKLTGRTLRFYNSLPLVIILTLRYSHR